MTVGQLSRHTGVPVMAVPRYTDWGLVNTLGRSAGNYRLFTGDAVWCLEQIGMLRDLGSTLAEIRRLAATHGSRRVGPLLAEFLDRATARLDAQIAAVQRTRQRINELAGGHRAMLTGQCGRDLWSGPARADRSAA
jgi:MerR family copper efflux transcriptional regulator